ncbi:quinone oxidoreductase-like protein 1 isoform X1 [Montipora foliosa]|uniref:quinone oxidoreductase-like protein 1 isoform X1 n=1 Tax=Montipora foliosa TaxID=591990 RepID=UPI0035F1CE07
MQARAVVVKRDERGHRVYELRESFDCPPLEEHNIAVKIKACGLSVHDAKILEEFNLISKKEQPSGREISGIVTNVGSAVTRVSIGDEVAGILPLDSAAAGCANFCVMSEYDVARKPEKVDHIDAAGCIGDVVKAYTALHYQGRVCSGETVLILNGASVSKESYQMSLVPSHQVGLLNREVCCLHNKASGVMQIQLAHIWGAKVLATASSEEEVIYLQSLQQSIANVVDLRSTKKSLLDICMDETGGLGVDCVIDNGGLHQDDFVREQGDLSAPNVKTSSPSKHDVISCLAVAGRWITCLHDLQLDPPDSQLLYLKGASVSFLFEHSWILSRGQQGRYLHILNDIMEKLSTSVIRPVIHHTVSLEDACDTLQHQFSNHKVGKIVVRM